MNEVIAVLPGAACLFAAATGVSASYGLQGWWRARGVRRAARVRVGLASAGQGRTSASEALLRYAQTVEMGLASGRTYALNPSVRAERAAKTRSGQDYLRRARKAGCSSSLTEIGFCEARTRLACAGGAFGAVLGSAFSVPLMVVLAASGALLGLRLLDRVLREKERERAIDAQRHLSEMLEVVALGLRSGLTFDRSFYLYGSHFDSLFAKSCEKAYRAWSTGLSDRTDALRQLAASYECDELGRAVDVIVRSLRFGTAFAQSLESMASESRAAYRGHLEERVAKAPVKMMLPTGTLILPAMLLLVMGPILLELVQGF